LSQLLEETRRVRSLRSRHGGEDEVGIRAAARRRRQGPPLHVLQVFQPETGGVPAYVAALVPGLRAAGIEVTVAGPAGAEALRRLRDQGVAVLPLAIGRSPHPVRDAIAVARLVRFARQRQVSIIHGHSTKAGMLAALAGARAGIPTVYTPHGWAFERLVALPVRAAQAVFERHLVRRYHARVLAVSRSGQEAAERWRVASRREVQVLRTGLPPVRAAGRIEARRWLGIQRDETVAVWVGRAGAQKRPTDLAEIARRLQGRVTVLALCHGAHGTPLEAELRRAGVVLAPADCPPALAYGAADMMLQTSAWEAAPLAVLEAMSAGLPVIAYDVGGLGEQVAPGRTGYLVAPGDIEMACECLLALSEQAEVRARMGQAGRRRVEQSFSYRTMLSKLITAYAELQAAPGPGIDVARGESAASEPARALEAMLG
jgi:glycosyltransferase involved in cell wall biosynthesis